VKRLKGIQCVASHEFILGRLGKNGDWRGKSGKPDRPFSGLTKEPVSPRPAEAFVFPVSPAGVEINIALPSPWRVRTPATGLRFRVGEIRCLRAKQGGC